MDSNPKGCEMNLKIIRERIVEGLAEFLQNADYELIVKSAYRIKHLLSALKDIAEIEKIYSEQTYETFKKLTLQELAVKYPQIAELLKSEMYDV
ncbi:MAG: hypothetical protein QXX84_06975 [Sulfolobales archaeon]